MRPVIIAVVFPLFIIFPLRGQTLSSGFLSGLVVSQVDGDPYKGYYKAGFTGGVFLKKRTSRTLSLQAEIKYIQKGSSDGNRQEGTNTYYRMILHYIEAPVLAQYAHNKHLTLEGGIAAGFLVHSLEKDENGIMFDTVPFSPFDLSGTAGFSYALTDRIRMGARFSYSILRIRKHAGGGEWYLNTGQRNNLFAFTVYYTPFAW